MKYIYYFALTVFFLFSCQKEVTPKIEKITPEKYLELKKDIHKKTIIHFWFSLCEPCIKDFPELLKITRDNKIDLINISSDKSDSKMQDNMYRIMNRLLVPHSYIIDYKNLYPSKPKSINIFGDFANKIGLKEVGNPLYILIDENGKTVLTTFDLNEIKDKLKKE